jgi:hypothetical protein
LGGEAEWLGTTEIVAKGKHERIGGPVRGPNMKGQSAGQKAPTADPGRSLSGQSVAAAIMAAAAEIGEDLRGKHGLQGYLRRLAVRHPPLFARLLSAAALPPEGKRAAAFEHQGPAMILQGGMTMLDVAAAFRNSGGHED